MIEKAAAAELFADRDEDSKMSLDGSAANGPAGPAGAKRPGGMPSKSAKDKSEEPMGREGGALQNPSLRTHFADTAFWTPAVVTDAQGHATVEVIWPDNLTQWRAAAVGVTRTAQVGMGEARVRTKKDVIVRFRPRGSSSSEIRCC